jgi:hypothetical protein
MNELAILRKHTQTEIIMLNYSCHPYEHKTSSINYLMNTHRVRTYPITKEAKGKKAIHHGRHTT